MKIRWNCHCCYQWINRGDETKECQNINVIWHLYVSRSCKYMFWTFVCEKYCLKHPEACKVYGTDKICCKMEPTEVWPALCIALSCLIQSFIAFCHTVISNSHHICIHKKETETNKLVYHFKWFLSCNVWLLLVLW